MKTIERKPLPSAQSGTKKSPKVGVFSFFSGCGLLDLGFEQAGFRVDFVNEFFQPFREAYFCARERMGIELPQFGAYGGSIDEFSSGDLRSKLRGQVRELKAQGDLSLFVGGPPCPDFSVGGKNRGQVGVHGRLTQSYIDLIEDLKPDIFLFENVKGLWRTKRHRAFYESLKQQLTLGGYFLCDQLVNSIQYGVAQDRDRIILIGVRPKVLERVGIPRGQKGREIFASEFPWEISQSFERSVLSDIPWPTQEAFSAFSSRRRPAKVPKELCVRTWFTKNKVRSHPNARHVFQPRAGLAKFEVIPEGDDSKKSYKRLHRWRYSPTACYGNNEVHLHPWEPRRISVAEALSIQSAPQDFVLPDGMSLTNMFKTIGNAVPVLAAQGLAQSVQHFLRNDCNS